MRLVAIKKKNLAFEIKESREANIIYAVHCSEIHNIVFESARKVSGSLRCASWWGAWRFVSSYGGV